MCFNCKIKTPCEPKVWKITVSFYRNQLTSNNLNSKLKVKTSVASPKKLASPYQTKTALFLTSFSLPLQYLTQKKLPGPINKKTIGSVTLVKTPCCKLVTYFRRQFFDFLKFFREVAIKYSLHSAHFCLFPIGSGRIWKEKRKITLCQRKQSCAMFIINFIQSWLE